MKARRAYRGIIAMAVGFGSFMLITHAAVADVQASPRTARSYNVWMVRAMDECNFTEDGTGPSVSVLDATNNNLPFAGLPSQGCLRTNVATDGLTNMKFGRLHVNTRGRVALFATGFSMGDAVRVRLTLRVTRTVNGVLHPPQGASQVTFEDQIVDCPKSPDSFSARPTGAVAGRTDLAACLSPDTGLGSPNALGSNIEILGASLVNADLLSPDVGKEIGVAGVIR